MYLTSIDRFMTKVELTETCWNWMGHTDSRGYGTSGRAPGTRSSSERAHRRAYRLIIGHIPEGMHLHHTCGNKRCVNPAHLKPVTAQEHMRLHYPGDCCMKGHPWPENARISSSGKKQCRACDAERKRRTRDTDEYRAYERARARRRRSGVVRPAV